jgi:DNA-binding transcriptional ArsR family regulator
MDFMFPMSPIKSRKGRSRPGGGAGPRRAPGRPAPAPAAAAEAAPAWTFLSNHGHVLVCVARDPDVRVRDVARQVGISERAVQRILGELEGAGYLERRREGRRNRYAIRAGLPLRHPVEAHRSLGDLVAAVARPPGPSSRAADGPAPPSRARRRTRSS